jgi:hypothetical protein
MNGKILFLSQTYNGSVHDKKICDLQPLSLPCGINLWQDTGFIGHAPQGVIVHMPFKKPKGKDLTEEQKKTNKKISSKRVYVEHAICRVKVYRIVKECLRCHKFGIDDLVMQIACALINYKLSMKTSTIAA